MGSSTESMGPMVKSIVSMAKSIDSLSSAVSGGDADTGFLTIRLVVMMFGCEAFGAYKYRDVLERPPLQGLE